jgi:hypothetical protein
MPDASHQETWSVRRCLQSRLSTVNRGRDNNQDSDRSDFLATARQHEAPSSLLKFW